jgi:sugar lactone lactonase YvrE
MKHTSTILSGKLFATVAFLGLLPTLCITSAQAQNLYVSNYNDGLINIYNPTGVLQGTFDSGGSRTALAFGSDGNLYAAGGSTIYVYNQAGNFQSNFTTTTFSQTYGLAFASNGNLYATDYLDSKINIFNPSGVLQNTIVSNVSNPTSIAFDPSGNFYVVNQGTVTISKFNSAGVFQSSFGSGNLNHPYGLAIDSSGNIYAGNYDVNTISIFDAAGAYQGNINTNLSNPLDLAFDSSGNLYVANAADSTISEFNSAGVFQSSFASTNPRGLAVAPASVSAPEPGTLALLALGGLACIVKNRRMRSLLAK